MAEKKSKPFEKRLFKKLYLPFILALFLPLFVTLYFAKREFKLFNKSIEIVDTSSDSEEALSEIKLVISRYKNNFFSLAVIYTAAVIFLGIIVLLFWYIKIIHPVNLLIQLARDIAKGKRELSFKLNTRDELYGLSFFLEKYSMNFETLNSYKEKNQLLYKSLGLLVARIDRARGITRENSGLEREAFIAILTDEVEKLVDEINCILEENRKLGAKLTEITIEFSKGLGEISTRVEREGMVLRDFTTIVDEHTQSIDSLTQETKKKESEYLKLQQKCVPLVVAETGYDERNQFKEREVIYKDIELKIGSIFNLKGAALDLSNKINILSLNSTILSSQLGDGGKEILKVSQEIARIAEKYPMLMENLTDSINSIKKYRDFLSKGDIRLHNEISEREHNIKEQQEKLEKIVKISESFRDLLDNTLNQLNKERLAYELLSKNLEKIFLNSGEKNDLIVATEDKIHLLSETYKKFYDVLKRVHGV